MAAASGVAIVALAAVCAGTSVTGGAEATCARPRCLLHQASTSVITGLRWPGAVFSLCCSPPLQYLSRVHATPAIGERLGHTASTAGGFGLIEERVADTATGTRALHDDSDFYGAVTGRPCGSRRVQQMSNDRKRPAHQPGWLARTVAILPVLSLAALRVQ
jgi:hypothetical protein